MTPVKESMTPAIIFMVIFSLRNTAAKITMKMGIVAIIRLAVLGEIYCSP